MYDDDDDDDEGCNPVSAIGVSGMTVFGQLSIFEQEVTL
jgi:hypothetical protein